MRRLSGSTNWFSFTNLTGSPSSTAPHTLFVVCATGTLPASGGDYRAHSLDTGSTAVAAGIRIDSAGGVFFSQRSAAGSIVYSYTQPSVFGTGSAPHALALVYDGTNCIAYVDGTQVNSAASGAFGARGAFLVHGSQTNQDPSESLDIGHALFFSQALTAAQIKTLGRSRVPVGIPSANVQGWWPYRTGRPAVDLSKLKQDLTGTTAAGAPDERWVGDMRRAKVFLPQYLLQPPIVLTAGNLTNAPVAAVTVSAVVASTASATSNCPSVALSRNLSVVSVAAAVSNAPSANVSAGAPVASVAASVTNVPTTNIAGGLGSTASTVTDCPAVSLARNLPIVSAAGATTNATAAIGSGSAVASTAGATSNATSANVTVSCAVASISAATSNAPSAVIATGASIAGVASTASNCPAAAIGRLLPVAAVSGARSDCPPANVVTLVFLPVSSVCRNVTDCPSPPPMTFFKDITAPPMTFGRAWPPRPR